MEQKKQSALHASAVGKHFMPRRYPREFMNAHLGDEYVGLYLF